MEGDQGGSKEHKDGVVEEGVGSVTIKRAGVGSWVNGEGGDGVHCYLKTKQGMEIFGHYLSFLQSCVIVFVFDA